MDHFAGLDISVKDTSVCIVDDTGKIAREVKVASEPDALLLSHIRFGHAVLDLEEQAGSGLGWRVTYRNESEERTEDFDFAVVCVGLYSETPNIPFFEGRDQFKGEIIHVSALKSRDQLAAKRVVVVGYGKSATDVAVE